MCGSLLAPSPPPPPPPVIIERPAPAPAPQQVDPVEPRKKTETKKIIKEVQETPAPQEQDPQVASARNKERRRRLQAAQDNDTLVTGGQGVLNEPNRAAKTLFGQ